MGLGKYGGFGVGSFAPNEVQQNSWAAADGGQVDFDEPTMSSSSSFSSSSLDDSTDTGATSSSFNDDLIEDASSSPSPKLKKGPLYELSELMVHLPIKRGLSMHYQGKSQSFTSLSNVKCLEDLAKKESPYSKRMKSCKSYGRLDCNTNKSYAPKTCSKIISKKASRGGAFLSSLSKMSSLSSSPRSPFSIGKNF